ncbi:MAG: SurA N-terminal domain-containing protein [Chloroflexota bacterium]|nr:SurA N-terminal domain-containing protein [Chloroflexota bacterium]
MSRKLKPEPMPVVAKKQPPKWQRDRNITRIVRIAFIAVIALILILVGFWGYSSYVSAWHQPVAKINDTVINMEYFVKMVRFHSMASGLDVNDYSTQFQVLRDIEDDELIVQQASVFGLYVTPEEITQTIKESIENSFAPPSADGGNATQGDGNETQPSIDVDAVYAQWLEQVQLSDDEYRQLIETDLLRDKIKERFLQEVPETAKHVLLRIIILEDEIEAYDALSRLETYHDGNFTALAEGIDETPLVLGWLPEGITPAYDDFAFNSEVGNVSAPIAGYGGYTIAEVSEIDEARTIQQHHREPLGTAAYFGWFEEVQETSIIEEYLDLDKLNWVISRI